jgi:ABC-type glycerol-3-phosphate transport system permease component
MATVQQRGVAAELGKHLFVLAVLAMAFFPLYVMLAISGKDGAQFVGAPLRFTLPFHWANFGRAWSMVSAYVFNTIFVCVTSVVLTFALTLNAAFFFARYRVPGGRLLWYFFLVLMIMPGIANLVPLFMLLKRFSLLNSFWALIVVYVTGGQVVQIYILRNFIEDIPPDLFDAAEVDGASTVQQVYHIVLPMSGSILSTLGILQFIGLWNDYVLPLIVMRDDRMLTMAVGLVRLDSEYVKDWGALMAGYALASIPMVLIFLFTMRLFVKGLAAGAVKG